MVFCRSGVREENIPKLRTLSKNDCKMEAVMSNSLVEVCIHIDVYLYYISVISRLSCFEAMGKKPLQSILSQRTHSSDGVK